MGRHSICKLCSQQIVGEEPVIIKLTGSSFHNKKAHAKCYEDYLKRIEKESGVLKKSSKPKEKKATKMSKEEIAERDELAFYIKDLLGYHILTKSQMHMINSLRMGQLIRKGDEIKGGCPYSVILLTFKSKRTDIEYALKTKHFVSEDARFRYVMAIVSNNINEIFIRWKEAEYLRKEIARNHQIEIKEAEAEAEATEKEKQRPKYVSKRNDKMDNPIFSNLWGD